MTKGEIAKKNVEIFEWMTKSGYDRKASKDIAPIITKYINEVINKSECIANITHWIAISDRLPEDSECILLGHSEDKWTDIGELTRTGKWYNGECEIYPTHWAKLPYPSC